MTTTGIAIIMILGIALVVLALSKMARRQHSARKRRLSQRMDAMAARLSLNLASREILSKDAMGIDCQKQKIIIVRENMEKVLEEFVIDMNTVSRCSLLKNYSSPHGTSSGGAPHALMEIMLCLEFAGRSEPVAIPFYRAIDNSIYELSGLESRAGAWEAILEKLIRRPLSR